MKDDISASLPDRINQIREIVDDVIPIEGTVSDSFLAEIYTAARKVKSQSISSVAAALGISSNKLKYYKENSPAVASVIVAGFMDGRADMEENLTKSLYNSATGNIILTDEQTYEIPIIDGRTGLQIGTRCQKKTIRKQVAPSVSAAVELLKRVNPAKWETSQKTDNTSNINQTLNVVDNRTINIDYRNLSPETIQELLDNEPTTKRNMTAYKREDGVSTLLLQEYRKKNNTPSPELSKDVKERPDVKTTANLTPKKLKTALDIGYSKSSKDAKKDIQKEKIAKIEAQLNSQKRPRGRPKKQPEISDVPKRPRGRPKKIQEVIINDKGTN